MGQKAAQNIQRYGIENIMQQWDLLLKQISHNKTHNS
jgi:hypothetical protein